MEIERQLFLPLKPKPTGEYAGVSEEEAIARVLANIH